MGIYKIKKTHLKNLKDGGIKEVIENIRIPAKDYENVIKNCREEKGLGRGKLAKAADIEEKYITKIEKSGKYPPNRDEFFSKLEEVLGVTLLDKLNPVTEDDGWYHTSYGILNRLSARMMDKGMIEVEYDMEPSTDMKEAAVAIRANNQFLEGLTGYTAKERSKQMKNKAKKD